MHNIALLNEVMDHIEAHPDRHTQGTWIGSYPVGEFSCQTVGCFAGWACLLSDEVEVTGMDTVRLDMAHNGRDLDPVLDESLPALAIKLLGLDNGEADWMFDARRSREDLRMAVDHWTHVAEMEANWFTPESTPLVRELVSA